MRTKYKILIAYYLLLVVGILLYINVVLLEGIPHVPDSAAYLFMAKLFAQGKVAGNIPVSPYHFNFFPGILNVDNGTWLFQYSFGHPLILIPGILIGFPNIIPPIIGVLFLLILFLVALEIYDLKTAFIVLLLPMFSPFFLENASEFMGHNTAALFLILSFYLLVLYKKTNKKIFTFLSAMSLGWMFNIRPLTSLPFIFIYLAIIFLVTKKGERVLPFIYFIFGFSIFIASWLLYNQLTTGNLFVSQYYSGGEQFFKSSNNNIYEFFILRFNNVAILFNNYIPMLFNLPFEIIIIPFAITFLIRKNSFWDNISLISIFSIPFVYFFYNGTFIMYGPRFWYETFPFVILLVGHGISILYKSKPKPVIFFICILGALSLTKLLGIIPTQDPDIFSPVSLTHLKTFNYTDSRILELVKKQNISNAVVFVKDTCQGQWWCYGSVFPQNSPNLNTSIVYAKDLGSDENKKLMQYFPNRTYYLIDYNSLQIDKLSK